MIAEDGILTAELNDDLSGKAFRSEVYSNFVRRRKGAAHEKAKPKSARLRLLHWRAIDLKPAHANLPFVQPPNQADPPAWHG